MKCSYCGEKLSGEEAGNPRKDSAGDVVCDGCYSEEYEFECSFCGNYDDVEIQHKMLAIFEDCGGLPCGVYSIDQFPYYISNYFDMWWEKRNMTRLGDIPPLLAKRNHEYPSGHLCYGCQSQMVFPRRWGVPETRGVGAEVGHE